MKNPPADNPRPIFSLKDKIFCIVFGFLLTLVVLEFFLRLLGIGYNLIHKAPVDTGADYRIYCVGESTTWGIGASDPVSKGYPHQLEKMLNKKYPGMKIQCLFDQTIGQNTSEILLKLPQYIKRHKPQLIIFMIGTNNWWNMDRSNILLFNRSPASEVALKILIFLDQFRVWKLFKHISFSLGLYKERWNYGFPRGKNVEELYEDIGQEVNLQIFNQLAAYDMEEMVKLCNANGIRTIVCNYPDPRISGWFLRSVQKNTARKFQIPFVDNHEVFQKLNSPEKYLRSGDYSHPNDAGYAIVAENIYKCILENRLIETKAKKASR